MDSPQQQQYQDDYEAEQNMKSPLKSSREGQIIQNKQPQERLVSLIRQKDENNQKDDKNDENNQKVQKEQMSAEKDTSENKQRKQKLIGRLKVLLHEKVEEVKIAKKSIVNCKKQIKQISEQVDKEMNKSILRHSKPYATVNIRTIFHSPKGQDPQVNKINEQISKLRVESKKLKAQIHHIENRLSNPISSINQERITLTKVKIKQTDSQLKSLEYQKQYLQKQIKMLVEEDEQQLDYQDQQFKSNRQRGLEISNQLKQQKNSLYEIDREDRIITQKLRYLDEAQSNVELRRKIKVKQNQTLIPKEQIQTEIKQLVNEINQILEKRNKVQNQKKNLLKNLNTQATSLQAKNWEIINKLREIDAYLIKHYSTKAQKKSKPHNQRMTAQDISKHSATISVKRQTNSKMENNDKNMTFHSEVISEPVKMVQKKKSYEFNMTNSVEQTNSSIIISDQMLGNKIKIKALNIVFDDQIMYGLWADYVSCQNNYQQFGYKILPKIRPKQAITKTLKLDEQKNQLINFVHIGNSDDGSIKYMHLITSEGNQFKWGNLNICTKNEQKNIRKYQSIVLKGKLNQMMNREAPNFYSLGGISFVILYLGPK